MRAMRIAIVGPAPPFRGGIAQHTAMLARALSREADVRLISFSRQYPSFLYPGEGDRDPAAPPWNDPAPLFIVDSLNPLSWRRAAREIAAFRPDLVIIPWWTAFWAPVFWFLARHCRRSGIHTRFFCHNVVEHESAAWKRSLTKAVLGQGSSFMVHTKADKENLEAILPDAQVHMHPHPIYEQFPDASEALPRRADLELLFFGLVRHYKGLDVLLKAVSLLKGQSVFLSVVGEFWEDRQQTEEQIQSLGIGHLVELVPRYVTDQEAANHFQRADAVVLPYRSATGSGVIAVAYHFDKPVIVTRVGGLPDVVDDGHTGLVVPPESPEKLAAAITAAGEFDKESTADAIAGIKRKLTWKSLARFSLQGIPANRPSR